MHFWRSKTRAQCEEEKAHFGTIAYLQFRFCIRWRWSNFGRIEKQSAECIRSVFAADRARSWGRHALKGNLFPMTMQRHSTWIACFLTCSAGFGCAAWGNSNCEGFLVVYSFTLILAAANGVRFQTTAAESELTEAASGRRRQEIPQRRMKGPRRVSLGNRNGPPSWTP